MIDQAAAISRILEIDDYYSDDSRLFIRFIRSKKLDLSIESLAAWIAELKEDGKAAATINRRLSALKARFRLLFEESGERAFDVLEKYSAEAALKAVKGQKINTPAVDPSKIVTNEEVSKLIKGSGCRIGLIVEFLYVTGCRISEACSVRFAHVRRERKSVLVRILGKGEKERAVRISVGLYLRIVNEFKPERFLFETVTGGPYSRQYVEEVFRATSDRELGRRVTPHCLRHTFATNMIAETNKIKGVSRYLGHADVTTTMNMYVQETLEFSELPSLTEKGGIGEQPECRDRG